MEAVGDYFMQVANERATVRGAYPASGAEPPPFDYTGLITVSGRYRGRIYVSAPRIMIRRLLMVMQEGLHSGDNLLDAAGEIANTLAGSARRHFGEQLEISVPVTIAGSSERVKSMVRARPYVIMVDWNHRKASPVVDMETVA